MCDIGNTITNRQIGGADKDRIDPINSSYRIDRLDSLGLFNLGDDHGFVFIHFQHVGHWFGGIASPPGRSGKAAPPMPEMCGLGDGARLFNRVHMRHNHRIGTGIQHHQQLGITAFGHADKHREFKGAGDGDAGIDGGAVKRRMFSIKGDKIHFAACQNFDQLKRRCFQKCAGH